MFSCLLSVWKRVHIRSLKRPFRSSLVPLFQKKSKCETILMKMALICMKMKVHVEPHFHVRGFSLRLVLIQRHKRTRKWPIAAESWCSSIMADLSVDNVSQVRTGFSRVFITLFCERDLAILAFSSLFLWLMSLRWWKRTRALTNCSLAWLLMALIPCRKVSSDVTFAFAFIHVYWSDLRWLNRVLRARAPMMRALVMRGR